MSRDDPGSANHAPTPAVLFAAVWGVLLDMMGGVATATLMRRAAKLASSRFADVDALAITRDQFTYRFVLPEAWKAHHDSLPESFLFMMRELAELLAELTGRVVLQRLVAVPVIQNAGLFTMEVEL
jgi:hypothetical protein